MENDEITQEVELELQDDQTSEAPSTEEDVTEDGVDSIERDQDATYWKNRAATLQRLLNKKNKPETPQTKEIKAPSQINNNTANSKLDIEKTVLLAGGMDSELLNQLEEVAKVKKIGLLEAKKTDLFKTIESQFEAKTKSEKAALGASRGSAKTPVKKSFDTPGLTAEEHKQMVKDLLNQ